MRIRGKLVFKSEKAGELVKIISRTLAPDNPAEIRTESDERAATISFSSDKIGTMLSSVDDYLMNTKIAVDMQKLLIFQHR